MCLRVMFDFFMFFCVLTSSATIKNYIEDPSYLNGLALSPINPAIVQQGGPPAGRVTEPRNLIPMAIGVGVVGVALVAILMLLLVITFL